MKTPLFGIGIVGLALAALALSRGATGAETAAAEAAEYAIDPTHSNVLFKVQHFGASWFYGRFNEVSGEVAIDREKPANSHVLMIVKASSVDAKVSKLTDHLRSPDFLDAVQFPEIVFESTKVAAGKKKGTFEVTGELTLHGVTKPLTVAVEEVGSGAGPTGGEIVGLHTTFTIDRGEFGLKYGYDSGAVGKEVLLIVSVEAQRR